MTDALDNSATPQLNYYVNNIWVATERPTYATERERERGGGGRGDIISQKLTLNL
jgi:hypothetical protein